MKEDHRFDLRGRVALVTGAGTGLGRHFALTLAKAGADVAVLGRRTAPLEQTAQDIVALGRRSHIESVDVGDADAIEAALDRTQSALGTIDILVNNAGANLPQPSVSMPVADWDHIIDTNLRGVFLLARGVGKRLIAAQKPGSVINIASVLGLRVQKGVSAYGASKAGVLHLTRVLALEWARHGIRVNSIAPGYFRTDITDEFLKTPSGIELIKRMPSRRVGEYVELEAPLLLLASDAGSYINGSELVIDGGLCCASL